MKTIHLTIQGTTPLLCNRFTDEAAAKASSSSGNALQGDKGTPREQAEPKLYAGSDGKPMIPGPNMFRCLIDAGKFFKSGKSKLTTMKNSLIPALVGIEETELTLKHAKPWEVDSRPVRIPSTGGRILAHRPRFDEWELSFTLTLDDSEMGIKLLRDVVDAAGKRIGLGDFRPDNKGMFGKFVITKWKVQAEAKPKAA